MDNRKGNRFNAVLRAELSRQMNPLFSFLLPQAVSSQMCTRRISCTQTLIQKPGAGCSFISVSYTHLVEGGAAEVLGRCGGLPVHVAALLLEAFFGIVGHVELVAAVVAVAQSFIPGSYTHLDVYKRQPLVYVSSDIAGPFLPLVAGLYTVLYL